MSSHLFRGFQTWSPRSHLNIVALICSLSSHFQLYLDSVVDNLQPYAIPLLTGIYSDPNQAKSLWALFIGARSLGMAAGGALSLNLNHKSGRKDPIIYGIVLSIVGIMMTSFLLIRKPWSIASSIIGRFLNGAGGSLTTIYGSVFISEVSPLTSRGSYMAVLPSLATIGELLGMLVPSLINSAEYWHYSMYLPLLVLIPSLFVMMNAPESPQFLMLMDKKEEASKSLNFYQTPSEVAKSYEDIQSEVHLMNSRARSDNYGMVDRFKCPRFLRALGCSVHILGFVHLNDWVWISFSTEIFTEISGLSEYNAQWASFLMCCPMTIISFGLLFVFDNFNRKTLLVGSTVCSVLLTIILLLFSYFGPATIRGPLSVVFPVISSLDVATAAVASESAFTIVPELFDPRDAAEGTAIATVFQYTIGFLLTLFVPSLITRLMLGMVLSIILNIVYCIIIIKYVPETNGRQNMEVVNSFSARMPSVVDTVVNTFNTIVRLLKPSIYSKLKTRLSKFSVFCLHTSVFFVLLSVGSYALTSLASLF